MRETKRHDGHIAYRAYRTAACLLGLAVVVACTSPSTAPKARRATLGTTSLPVVTAATLPGTLGARLEKTCTPTFPPGVERMLFGAAGAPTHAKAPRRVVPAPAASGAFTPVAGRISLSTAADKRGSARATVGTRASEATALVSADGGVAVDLTLRGATSSAATSSGGLLVIPGGHPSGDVVVRPTGDGLEDWLLLPTAPASPRIEYDVALTRGVAAVRSVGSAG